MKTLTLLIVALVIFNVAQAAPEDARALFDSGIAKMTQAGTLAREGKFVSANDLLRAGSADMDRAIAMSPDDVELRARRGLLFHRLLYLQGKSGQAAQDLRWVKDHPRFQELPQELRTSVEQALSATRPDRFPYVSATTSPVVAALSFTAQGQAGATPGWIDRTTRAIHDYPGLLGTHAVASVDHPGMYILFTWWADKSALNNFYYSDMHQRWMRTRGATMMAEPGSAADKPESLPTQTAAEVLGGFPVPGGRINGGFVPQEVVERFTPSPERSIRAK